MKLTQEIGSRFFQTNINPDTRAFHPDAKFVADATSFEENESEQNEGAAGSIRIIVDRGQLLRDRARPARHRRHFPGWRNSFHYFPSLSALPLARGSGRGWSETG